MKLEHYAMLEAFNARDVAAILRIVEQHYHISLPQLQIVLHDISNSLRYNRDPYQVRIDLDDTSYMWNAENQFFSIYAENYIGSYCQIWW